MLTQNELNWLTERDKEFFYSCRYCPGRDKQTEKSLHECMSFCWDNNILAPCAATTNELRFFQDAAEFEARVAAKLARNDFITYLACGGRDNAYYRFCAQRHIERCWDCADCYLKIVRLLVEEEIDG